MSDLLSFAYCNASEADQMSHLHSGHYNVPAYNLDPSDPLQGFNLTHPTATEYASEDLSSGKRRRMVIEQHDTGRLSPAPVMSDTPFGPASHVTFEHTAEQQLWPSEMAKPTPESLPAPKRMKSADVEEYQRQLAMSAMLGKRMHQLIAQASKVQQETERILNVVTQLRPARQNYQVVPSSELTSFLDMHSTGQLEAPNMHGGMPMPSPYQMQGSMSMPDSPAEKVANTALGVNHGNPGAAMVDLLSLVMKKKVDRMHNIMDTLHNTAGSLPYGHQQMLGSNSSSRRVASTPLPGMYVDGMQMQPLMVDDGSLGRLAMGHMMHDEFKSKAFEHVGVSPHTPPLGGIMDDIFHALH